MFINSDFLTHLERLFHELRPIDRALLVNAARHEKAPADVASVSGVGVIVELLLLGVRLGGLEGIVLSRRQGTILEAGEFP